MHSECFQMPPKLFPDASQMRPRCFPDVFQMRPRCFSDASQRGLSSMMSSLKHSFQQFLLNDLFVIMALPANAPPITSPPYSFVMHLFVMMSQNGLQQTSVWDLVSGPLQKKSPRFPWHYVNFPSIDFVRCVVAFPRQHRAARDTTCLGGADPRGCWARRL